jgi:hypothetical protein
VGVLRKLAIIGLPEVIVLCFVVTYFWIDLQSIVTLLVFNVVFISLLTLLNGDRCLKMGLLAAGNVVGMAWNYCFHIIMIAAADSLTVSNATLSVFYTIAYPFLNSFWVIAFWSLSLTTLHHSKALQGAVLYGH